MAPLCPNLSNKKVKQAFDEMTQLFGEDLSYLLWNKNGGYPLDLAPNGASSILFDSLLQNYDGDRKAALKAKAKTYSSNFVNWFGNWMNEDKTNVSKAVDKNGEPLVLWHGTENEFDTFQFDENGSYGRHLVHDPHSFFFTDSKEKAFKYKHAITMPVYLNMRNPGYSSVKDGKFKTINEYTEYENSLILDNQYDSALIERYDKEGDNHGLTPTKQWVVKNPNQIKSIDSNNFSTSDNNIYHNQQDLSIRDEYLEAPKFIEYLQQKYLYRNYLNTDKVSREKIKTAIRKELDGKFKHLTFYFNFDRDTKRLNIKYRSKDEKDFSEWGNIIFGKDNKENRRYTTAQDSEAVVAAIMRELRGSSIHEQIIQRLVTRALRTADIRFDFSTNLGSDVAAKYVVDGALKIIYVNPNAAFINTNNYKNSVTQTILHEVLHAITEDTINRNAELYNQIDRLRKEVIKELGNDANIYGLKNVHEFMAELSNMQFIEKLKTVKTEKRDQTFFQKVKHMVHEIARVILGSVVKDYNGTAYADAMEMLVKSVFPEEYKLPLADVKETVRKQYNQTSANPNNPSSKLISTQSKLIKQFSKLEKLYEKMPNKSASRQAIQDELFETISKLKVQNEQEAITIAFDQMLKSIGSIDEVTGNPTNNFSTLGYLYKQSQLPNPYSGITPEILMDMYRNSISFYRNMLDSLPQSVDTNLAQNNRSARKTLEDSIKSAEQLWKEALIVVTDNIVDQWISDDFVRANQETVQEHKEVLKDYLHYNIMHGDISGLEKLFENAAFSSNPIIKYMHNELSYANLKIQRESNNAAVNIRKAYKQANTFARKFGPNWQSKLMEFGDDGLPTGYFVRPVNYGQYQLDLNNFISELNDRFDHTPGIMHHYIFDEATDTYINSVTGQSAEDEQWGPNGEMPDYYKYMLEIEKWKCDHAERRYTFEYYKERMSKPISVNPASFIDGQNAKGNHGLSPRTLIRYNRIQSKINYYLDKCTDEDGFVIIENLDKKDLQKYDAARRELENLSNPFEEDGSIKSDEDLQMAMEIKSWQSFINNGTDVSTDYYLYNEELAKITDPVKRANFIKYNSRYSINPEYLKLMPTLDRTSEDYDVIKARYIKSMLQNCVMYDHATTLEKDLGKYENYNAKSFFWKQCKENDQIIADGSQADKDFVEEFGQNFKSVQQVYRDKVGNAYHIDGTVATQAEVDAYYKENDSNVRAQFRMMTWFDYMINKYVNEAQTKGVIANVVDPNGNLIDFTNMNPDAIRDVITDLFTYTRSKYENGMVTLTKVPLSIFSNIYPTQEIDSHGHPSVTFVPTGRFSEKYNPRFFNRNYNIYDRNSEQPKVSDENGEIMYSNLAHYEEVVGDPKLKLLYDTLIDAMKDAQKDYSSKNGVFNYRLPKYEASNTAQISRMFKQGYKLSDIYQALHDSVLGTRASDEDMRRSDDYTYNVHNAFDSDVSLRHIGQLENRARYTYDVTASVLMFIHMAKNYKYKKQVEPKLWAIRQALDPDNRIGDFNTDENSLAVADNVLNTGLYGSSVMDEKSAKYMNISRIFQGQASKMILGLNILSMVMGASDAFRVLVRDSLVGRYFTPRDLMTGIFNLIKSLPKMIMNIGQPLANCKTIAIMQRFGISTKYRDSSENIGDSKTVKLLKNLLMGGFRLGDFTTSAIATKAFMNNFRFYNGNKAPKGFYTQFGLQQAFEANGHSASEANLARMTSFTTLWDAYSYRDGNVTIKPEYQQYVTDKLEKQFRSTAINRAGMIQGVNIDEDTPMYKGNIWLSFIGAMRGWMFQRGQEMFSGRDDTSARKYEDVPEDKVINGKTVRTTTRKFLKKTKEQEFNRESVDPGRGEPLPEEYKACWRAFVQMLQNVINKLSFGALAKDKYRKFSYSERKASKQVLIEIGMVAALIYGMPLMFNFQADADDDDDWDRSDLTMPEVLQQEWITYKSFFRNDIYKKALYNTYIRLTISALEQETPMCVADLCKTISVFTQNINQFGYGTSYLMRKLYGEEGADLIKNGSYKGFTVDQRDLLKFTYVFDNLHKSLSNQGIENNTKFYLDTFVKEAFFLKLLNFDIDELKDDKSEISKPVKAGSYEDDDLNSIDLSDYNFGDPE